MGGQWPKAVKGAQSDPNYVSRLLLDCVPVFHKTITSAYLLYRSGPVAIYSFKGGQGPVANVCRGGAKIIVTPLVRRQRITEHQSETLLREFSARKRRFSAVVGRIYVLSY